MHFSYFFLKTLQVGGEGAEKSSARLPGDDIASLLFPQSPQLSIKHQNASPSLRWLATTHLDHVPPRVLFSCCTQITWEKLQITLTSGTLGEACHLTTWVIIATTTKVTVAAQGFSKKAVGWEVQAKLKEVLLHPERRCTVESNH